jgi:uncharacterized protein involved in exopolysaccharide biosynthesis
MSTVEKNNTAPLNDEISLKELIFKGQNWLNYFWTYKWLILLVIILGSIIGFCYAMFYSKNSYTAELTFAMEQKGGGSSLSGLASSLGLEDIGASSSGMFGGENILHLLKSNRIIHEALKEPLPELEGDHLLNAYLKNNFEKALKQKKIKLFPKQIDSLNSTRAQDSLLLLITKNIREGQLAADRTDKKTTIVSLEVIDNNEKWAFLFSKMLVKHAIELYLDIKIGRLLTSELELTRKRDSIRGLLDGSITTLAIETDLSSHSPLMRYKSNQAKKQVDVEVLKSMYSSVIQNLEITKFKRSQEEPIIEIIDEPILPLKVKEFGKAKGIIFGGFLSGFLIIGFLIIRKVLKGIMN